MASVVPIGELHSSSAITHVPPLNSKTLAIGNPATSEFLHDHNQTRGPLMDPKIHPNSLVTYPDLEIHPANASALCDTLLTSNSFRIGSNGDEPLENINYAVFAQQVATAGIRGYRTGLPPTEPSRMGDVSISVADLEQVDAVRHREVLSSAEYGYHGMDGSVLNRVRTRQSALGDGQHGRAYGLERFENTAIIARAHTGLGFNSAAAVPSNDDIRMNSQAVKPVQVAAPNIHG